MRQKPFRSDPEDTLLISLLIFAPLALASVHTWAYSVIELLAVISFGLHFSGRIRDNRSPGFLPLHAGILLFLAVNILYIIPIPIAWIKAISPHTYSLRVKYMINPGAAQPLSLYSHATMIYIMKFTAYAMVFFVVVSRIRSGGRTSEAVKAADRGSRPRRGPVRLSYILLGALCGLLAILFHSLSDFNTHIPANALYFTVIMALVAGLGTEREKKKRYSLLSGPGDAGEKREVSRYENGIDGHFVKKIVNTVILTGFGIAVFGIIQKFSYNGKIYWIIEKAGGHFGPYINYDHYAGYMSMCAMLAISMFLTKVAGSSLPHIKKLKDRILWLSSPEANKTLIYLFMSIVMTAALFLTTSRGGIMSFTAALAVFYFVCVISASRRKRRRILLASLLAVMLMVIMIMWVGPEQTVNRFKVLSRVIKLFIHEKAILSELRPYMWKDTLPLIKDFPVTGTGLGTYASVFPQYRTFPAQWGFLRYAHNDYLQLIAEMGAVGGAFLLAFLVWYFRRFRECVRRLRLGAEHLEK